MKQVKAHKEMGEIGSPPQYFTTSISKNLIAFNLLLNLKAYFEAFCINIRPPQIGAIISSHYWFDRDQDKLS